MRTLALLLGLSLAAAAEPADALRRRLADCEADIAKGEEMKARLNAAPDEYDDVPATLASLDRTLARLHALKARLERELRDALAPRPPSPAPSRETVAAPIETGREYLEPGVKRPGLFARVRGRIATIWDAHFGTMTPQERKRLEEVRAALSALPTGKALIAALGGWEAIDREILIRIGLTPSTWTRGMTMPWAPIRTRHAGRRYLIVLQRAIAGEPPRALAPILGHELQHVLDLKRGHHAPELQLELERGAHRVQVYLHLEAEGKASPEELRALASSGRGQRNRFIADIWVDRFRERHGTVTNFARRYGDRKLLELTGKVWAHVMQGRVQPGGAQLDFHIEENYKVLTKERDIRREIVEKPAKAGAKKERQDSLLKQADAMRAEAERVDAAYRRANGYELRPSK